jgi:hypothetical protein
MASRTQKRALRIAASGFALFLGSMLVGYAVTRLRHYLQISPWFPPLVLANTVIGWFTGVYGLFLWLSTFLTEYREPEARATPE